ncbi:MAG: DUF4294 domain-containing protein [Bacteroidota bacterium]
MKKLVFILVLLLCSEIYSQEKDQRVYEAVVSNNDTIPVITLDDIVISSKRKRNSRRYQRRYGRIKKKVLKVYPYSQITKELIEDYETELKEIENEKERKIYMKNAEDELKAEFEGEIRNLTISEGRILIKLIDRETGKTSFELIRQLRGAFTAFMWQSVAKIFGSNLKQEYDAEGDDEIIEEIIVAIERGELRPLPRKPITEKAKKRLERKKLKRAKKQAKRLQKQAK